MRVFITGASGFIGSIITKELIADGHKILGLARSEASAQALIALGAEVHQGDLQDLESLKTGAALSDGVIHTAFIHDFSRFKENSEIDRQAIETMGAVLAGSDRPMIITSGTGMNESGSIRIETDGIGVRGTPRMSEDAAAHVAGLGVRASIVRLPPSVHSREKQGLVSSLIDIARQKGVSAYIGEGHNCWPAVHHYDAARVFKLAFEKGARDFAYHAVAEEGVSLKDIAEAIGKGLNIPVVSRSAAEASDHFGWFAPIVAADLRASSALTKQRLGWAPTHPGLLEDLADAAQFR